MIPKKVLISIVGGAAALALPLVAMAIKGYEPLLQMVRRLPTVEQINFSGNVISQIQEPNFLPLSNDANKAQSIQTDRLDFTGAIDRRGGVNRLFTTFTLPGVARPGNATSTPRQMHLIVINRDFYVSFNDPELFDPSLPLQKNEWIKITEEDLRDLNDQRSAMTGLPSPVQELKKTDILAPNNIFSISDGTEVTIGATKAYLYTIGLQRDKLPSMISRAYTTLTKDTLSNADLAALTTFLNNSALPSAMIYVDKNTSLPLSAHYHHSFKDATSKAEWTVFGDINFYKDNATPEIIPPTTFKTVKDLMEPQQEQARDSKRLSDLRQIQTALELYHADQGVYPTGQNMVLGSSSAACLNETGWRGQGCPTAYMAAIPADPGQFAYTYTASGNTYTVNAALEGKMNNLEGAISLTPSGLHD